MTRTDDPTVRYPLLIALGRICLYLGANEGPPLRLNGVKALITSWSNAGAEISSNLAEGLAWQCTTMTTDEIVGLLRHPLAAGDVQAGLLLALSQRCRRTFSSTWQFLDWAEANGIDFTTRT